MKSTRTYAAIATSLLLCAVLPSAQTRSFAWYAELVAIDQPFKTLTMKAAIRESAAKFLRTYQPGDRVVLLWEVEGAAGGEGQSVLALATPQQTAFLNDGYISRVEFVAGDSDQKTVTFKIQVPDAILQTATSIPTGHWIKVSAPMEQGGPHAVVTKATAADKPIAKSRATPAPAPVSRATAVPVKANGGISGRWDFHYQPQFVNRLILIQCDLAQDGPLIGGTCKEPEGAPMPVSGRATGSVIELQIPHGGNVYTGTLDAFGTAINGTMMTPLTGVEMPFNAGKI